MALNNRLHIGKGWHGVIAVLILIFFSCGLINYFGLSHSSFATSLSLNVSTDVVALDLFSTTSAGTFAKSNDVTITVSTDNIYGYTLGIRANSSQSLNGEGSAAGHSFTSIDGQILESEFSSDSSYNNKWGFRPSFYHSSWNYISYFPAPSTTGDVINETSCANGTPNSDCKDTSDTYTFTVGARANNSTKPGTYSSTFTIYAIAYSISGYMQDFTDKDCGKLKIGDNVSLYDRRDGKEYTVTRLGDGLCWMTSDLRVGSTTEETVLTSNDSDVTSPFTLPVLETSSTKTQWGTTGSTTGLDEAHGYQYSGTKTFYNWYTATAGTTYTSNSATTSICPSGWKLPTDTQTTAFFRSVGETTGSQNVSVVRDAPVSLLPNYYNSATQVVYSNRYYWLASGFVSSNVYYAKYFGERYSGGVYYLNNSYGLQKMMGLSVRCVHASDQPSGFKVFFDGNGGSVAYTSITATAPVVMDNLPSATRAGYVFNGWYTEPEGGEEISIQTISVGISGYYAHWLKNYSITFNYSGLGGLAIIDQSGKTVAKITSSGGTVSLPETRTYTIKALSGTLSSAIVSSGAGTMGIINDYEVDYTLGNGIATVNLVGLTIPVMQSMASSSCTTSGSYAYDNRDGEVYYIKRLADGRCWMLDNLRLDPVEVSLATLRGNTNASNETLNYLKGVSVGTASDKYATSGVSKTWSDGNSNSDPRIAVDSSSGLCEETANKKIECANSDYSWGSDSYISSTPDGESTVAEGKIGVYYNYCAATAGSYCYGDGDDSGTSVGNATEDLCPTGWRMPTGSNSSNSSEYIDLINAYNDDYTEIQTALRTPLSGAIFDGHAQQQKTDGYFWSSTRRMNNLTWILSVEVDDATTAGWYRDSGTTMRCTLDS